MMKENEADQINFNAAITLIKEYFSSHKEKDFIISVTMQDNSKSKECEYGK